MRPDYFQEINFPPASSISPGYLHEEPKNGITYIWDGTKWDPYEDLGNYRYDKWSRVEPEEVLYPTDSDDVIRVRGIQDRWIKRLPDRGGE